MANLFEILEHHQETQKAVIRRMNENTTSPYGVEPRILSLLEFEQKLYEDIARKGVGLDEKSFSYREISEYIWSEIREINQQIWQEESEKLSG